MIRIEALEAVWSTHPEAEGPMLAWFNTVEAARWNDPADVKQSYRSADILKNSRVVFNVNSFRIVAKVKYRTKVVFIRFAGTHAEYDEIDANAV